MAALGIPSALPAFSSTHQELLRDSLAATGHVETACLIRIRNGAVRAVSPGFEPSDDQVTALLEAFSDTDEARKKGIRFNGAHYICCRADANSIYAKKESSGFVAVRTKQYIIYGSYSTSMYPSVCVEAVENLGDYYRHKNY